MFMSRRRKLSTLSEEKCHYVVALVKEALRFYPPLKILPARQTYKEFVYQGAIIPKGVLIYTNCQAILQRQYKHIKGCTVERF